MRRVGAILVVGMLLALTVASPAAAKKPAPPPPAPDNPVVTWVKITETGGKWANCEQRAEITYTWGSRPGYIEVRPYREGALGGNGPWAKVSGSGTVALAVSCDYSQDSEWAMTPGWSWIISSWTMTTRRTYWHTATYDFKGACPEVGTVLVNAAPQAGPPVP